MFNRQNKNNGKHGSQSSANSRENDLEHRRAQQNQIFSELLHLSNTRSERYRNFLNEEMRAQAIANDRRQHYAAIESRLAPSHRMYYGYDRDAVMQQEMNRTSDRLGALEQQAFREADVERARRDQNTNVNFAGPSKTRDPKHRKK